MKIFNFPLKLNLNFNLNCVLAIVLLFFSQYSLAGSTQSNEILFPIEQVETFAKKVEKYAAAARAHVFIIARLGRPAKELPTGIHFTHTAIAVYSEISLETGEKVKGYAIHNLYQKQNQLNESELVIDYPVDFFWGVNELKAGIIIPKLPLQKRLLNAIAKGVDKKLHNKQYSVIANPYNSIYQNCTEYVVDIINASIYQTTDITVLKNNAKQHFQAQRVRINPIKLMLGNLFVKDVSTKDHHGKIKTATFMSIAQYLKENDLLAQAVIIDADKGISALF